MKLKIKKIINWVLIFLGFTALIYIIRSILCFTDIPRFLFGGTNNQNFNGEFVKFVATIFGGLLVLFGLWLNYKRTKNLENQTKVLENQTKNQADQIKAFIKQNEITEKGKVDERFKNAIEHLGSDKDAIVLGGIYALHRIAQEDKSYRQTVFDILCSYIRDKTSTLKLWSDLLPSERVKIKPTIVIQAIIDLLFKSSNDQEYIYKGLKANLSGIRCINADLDRARLVGANLNNSHLEGAFLEHAQLENAYFSDAYLTEALLGYAVLNNANLIRTVLSEADLNNAELKDSFLNKADLEGVDLNRTHLEGASLDNAHLEGAMLSGTHLEGAYLNEVHLEGAFLNRVCLENTFLVNAHLEGAMIWSSHFEGANLRELHIEGANIFNSYFEGVYSDGSSSGSLKDRIGKVSEFMTVYAGKLDEVSAKELIEKFSSKFGKNQIVARFTTQIMDAVTRDTNIEKDAITGILTKEKADEIIERYNKAMANVPKR